MLTNVSFNGSPVQFLLDSPLLVCCDPLALEWTREQIASLPADLRSDPVTVLTRINVNVSAMSRYEIADFRPGIYTLDPRDIVKFGDEDEAFDYEDSCEDETKCADAPASFPWVIGDSGTLVFVDFAHLSDLVALLTWEQYDLTLQDDAVFGRIADSLGGPYFAVISGGCMPGIEMDFDGDGTYTLRAGAVKAYRG